MEFRLRGGILKGITGYKMFTPLVALGYFPQLRLAWPGNAIVIFFFGTPSAPSWPNIQECVGFLIQYNQTSTYTVRMLLQILDSIWTCQRKVANTLMVTS